MSIKIALSSAFVLLSLTGFGQKFKNIEICTGPYKIFHVSAIIKFQDNVALDTTIQVTGRNHRYSHITDLITLKSGSFNDVWNFFIYCLDFLDKESDGTSEMKDGHILSVSQMMGIKGLTISGEGKDANGYTGFSLKYLDKLLSCMEDWQQKRK